MGAMQSILEHGDEFIFGGLLGEPMAKDFVRHITIVGISVGGNLQYRLEVRNEAGVPVAGYGGPSLDSVPYDLALLLVEQGVWLEPEDYARKVQLGKLKFT